MHTTTEAERTTATQNSNNLEEQTSVINTHQSALKAHAIYTAQTTGALRQLQLAATVLQWW